MQKTDLALEDDLIFVKPDPTKKALRIGVVGAGRIGQVHATNITFRLKNAILVGVSSGSRELAERCSLDHGCQPYTDYDEMLENPELDAVCICSASNQVRADENCICARTLSWAAALCFCIRWWAAVVLRYPVTNEFCVCVSSRQLCFDGWVCAGPSGMDLICSCATLPLSQRA